jgi:hypothetical protein
MKPPLSKTRLRAAWAIAIVVDALQIAVFPATIEGAFSPLNDGLDFVAMGSLFFLLGWHWAFLPTVLAELVPGLDLVPTWTIAVGIATRGRGEVQAEPGAPKVINPEVMPPDGP